MGSLVGEGVPTLTGQVMRCEAAAVMFRSASRTSATARDREGWSDAAQTATREARRYRREILGLVNRSRVRR